MSVNSFPRPEHLDALLEYARTLLVTTGRGVDVESNGLDRFHCQYRLKFRHRPSGNCEEVSIHFQLAEKVYSGQGTMQLDRQLAAAVQRCEGNFAEGAVGGR